MFYRFHVTAQINQAIERVRREEQQANSALKKTRYIWLKNPKNPTEKQAVQLEQLKGPDLKTALAYQIKLAPARFWEIADPTEAVAYLKRCCFWATHSRLSPVIKAARTIKRCWPGVVRYLHEKITKGVVEGLNSKIKTAMKRAYGFKHVGYLRTIVYIVAGKLGVTDPY